MDRKEWSIKFKNCKAKYYPRWFNPYREKGGNLMCGEMFPFGKRCTYKTCPLIKEKRNEPSND